MTHQAEKILVWILRAGLVLSLFSVVIVNFNFFFPFIIPRATYFQTVSAILFAVSAILLLFFPHAWPRKNWISRALALYFVVGLIVTLASADPAKSFIGTIERDFGFWHVLHFGAVFLAAVLALRTRREWNIFFGIMVAVSLYPALDFVIGVLKSDGALPPTIMGNPTFLSAYLVFHLYFAGYLITQTHRKSLKAILAAAILFEIVVTIMTGVRGAFLGLCASAAFLVFIYAWRQKAWRAPLIGLFLVLVSTYALIFVNRDNDLIRKNYIFQKITNFSLEDETIKARFAMWRIAWSGFKENPMLGWGRENYSLVFNKHFHPSFNQARVGEGWEDRTHNIFFDELVHGGLIGLAAYLALLLAVFLAVRKNTILLTLFIAYLVLSLFGVESLNSYLPLYLFLAFLVAEGGERQEPALVRKVSPALAYGASAIIILAVTIAIFALTIQPALGNRRMFRAFFALAQNDFFQFEKLYGEAKEKFDFFPSLKVEAIAILNQGFMPLGNQFVQLKTYGIFADKISTDLDPLSKRNPLEQRWRFGLGQLYLQWAIAENFNDRLVKANAIINGELLAASPYRNIFLKMKDYAIQVRRMFIIQQQEQTAGTKSGK